MKFALPKIDAVQGTWIEIAGTPEWSEKMTSSPSRGTWIEIPKLKVVL